MRLSLRARLCGAALLAALGFGLGAAIDAAHARTGVPRGTLPVDISPDPQPPAKAAPAPAPKPKQVTYRLRPPHCCPIRVEHGTRDTDAADWGHDLIGVPAAWKTSAGKGVKVAVLDTGADHEHRDLKGRILVSKDFTGSMSGAADVHGHGSHTAGIVAAERNDTGMVGVAPDARLVIGKVLNDTGSGTNRQVADGIDWAVEQGADVISMSLGGSSPDDLTHEAIKRAVARGVIVVCAAGNDGPAQDSVNYPAGYPESLAVGAVDKEGKVAEFSSRGAAVYVSAPGVEVRSCYPGDRFATMSGTSMATPYVAGCAALYVSWARANDLKPSADDFKARLAKSSTDILPAGRDPDSGYGIVRPAGLFELPPDVIEWTGPGIEWNGRKVRRIVIELEPKPRGGK